MQEFPCLLWKIVKYMKEAKSVYQQQQTLQPQRIRICIVPKNNKYFLSFMTQT